MSVVKTRARVVTTECVCRKVSRATELTIVLTAAPLPSYVVSIHLALDLHDTAVASEIYFGGTKDNKKADVLEICASRENQQRMSVRKVY